MRRLSLSDLVRVCVCVCVCYLLCVCVLVRRLGGSSYLPSWAEVGEAVAGAHVQRRPKK